MKIYRKAFREITIMLEWFDEYMFNRDPYRGYGDAELMVHIGNDDANIESVYTYTEDTKGMPRKWIKGISKNPLFTSLNKRFIQDNKLEIDDLVSNALMSESEDEIYQQRKDAKMAQREVKNEDLQNS